MLGHVLSILITRGAQLPKRTLFWERGTGVEMRNFNRRLFAVRDGNWKLVCGKAENPVELYDLLSDPVERHNLASTEPEVVKRLQATFEKRKADVYSDCPYQIDKLIGRLKTAGIIKK